MKKHLYLLMLTILVVLMSELQIAGMMPRIAEDLGVTTGQVGYLVSLYGLGQALGGPSLVFVLRHTPPKRALLSVIALYAVAEVLVPLIHEYWWIAILRVLTGCLSGAAFGLSVSYGARLVDDPGRIGEAVSIVLSGITVGTVIGLPLSHAIAEAWHWQISFILLGAVAFLLFVVSLIALPGRSAATTDDAARDLRNLRSPRLWSRFLVSLLTIGAAFGSFSYFTPLLEQDAMFSSTTTTAILLAYGAVSFFGNLIIGKFADQHAVLLLRIGHGVLTVALAVLGLFSDVQPVVILAVLVVGAFGVTMNPPLVARVAAVGGTGNMVSTVHTAMITMGVTLGSAFGASALSMSDQDPSAAMWTSTGFVVLAAIVLALQTGARRSGARQEEVVTAG